MSTTWYIVSRVAADLLGEVRFELDWRAKEARQAWRAKGARQSGHSVIGGSSTSQIGLSFFKKSRAFLKGL